MNGESRRCRVVADQFKAERRPAVAEQLATLTNDDWSNCEPHLIDQAFTDQRLGKSCAAVDLNLAAWLSPARTFCGEACGSQQILDVVGELSNHGAPAVEEAQLFVLVAIAPGSVHPVSGVMRSERMIVQRDDRGHERLLRGSP